MIEKLDSALKVVCPIHGVSVGRRDDKATWRINFKDEATAQERDAAQAVIDAFDPVAADVPIDFSDADNMEKALKALGLVCAAWNGKTPAQLKSAFKTAWDILP